MKLCRLIFLILVGLLISRDGFAGKRTDERRGASTTPKCAKTPADELLDALSMIFETTDHHEKIVMGSLQTMPQIELEHRPKYGDKMPHGVARYCARCKRKSFTNTEG